MWWLKAAQQGHPDAQQGIGHAYWIGQGVAKQDHAKAIGWFRLASDQGQMQAQHNLGFAYWIGSGVPQDHAEGVRLYRLAADQVHGFGARGGGGGGAMWRRWGQLSTVPFGLSSLTTSAPLLHCRSQGLGDAQYCMGVAFASGRGVAKNLKVAAEWWAKSRDSGYPKVTPTSSEPREEVRNGAWHDHTITCYVAAVFIYWWVAWHVFCL
jgi:TPR repeat protein